MLIITLGLVVAATLSVAAMSLFIFIRRNGIDPIQLNGRLDSFEKVQERTERIVKEEIVTGRQDTIDKAEVRTRAIDRKLRRVQEVSTTEAKAISDKQDNACTSLEECA